MLQRLKRDELGTRANRGSTPSLRVCTGISYILPNLVPRVLSLEGGGERKRDHLGNEVGSSPFQLLQRTLIPQFINLRGVLIFWIRWQSGERVNFERIYRVCRFHGFLWNLATAFPEEHSDGRFRNVAYKSYNDEKGRRMEGEERGKKRKRTMQRFVFILAYCQGSMTWVDPFSKIRLDIKV